MSRVADRVAAANFGSPGRGPRSERGRAKAQAEGTIPEYDLQRLRLALVAPCPMNPRRNYGTDEQKTVLGLSLAKKQTTACVAVTREAYLKLWPSHEQLIDAAAEHVLLNGERRYRSARHVDLDALDFVIRDDLATSRADFVDYLMVENEEREDFDVVERARGLKQLLDACDGNAAEVARRRGRDRSWVGNQIALLSLPAAIQDRLASGELAERYGRRLARAYRDDPDLSVDDLLELAETLRDGDRIRREEDRALREEDRALREEAKASMLSADNTDGMLSADNIGTAALTDLQAPVGTGSSGSRAGGMLSADNTGEVLSADNMKAMLSADNMTRVGQREVPEQRAERATAHARVQRLGETAAERARTLQQGCSSEEFKALLEEMIALS